MINKPYLSVVIVSRNDNHGLNMFRRMQVCIDGIIEQLERFKIPSEVILVEWIPPSGRPLLRDIYPWRDGLKYCNIRVIIVPSSVIGNYEWSEDFSIRDLTPWNVGIRRAKGGFILSTVTDVLLSDEMVSFFAEQTLDAGAMYRIDRCDVNRDVVSIETLDDQLEYCKRNIVDMHTLNPLKFLFKKNMPIIHDKAPGDFILMSREKWRIIHGFPEGVSPGADNVLLIMAYLSGVKQIILKHPIRLYHIEHDSIWKRSAYIRLRRCLIKLGIPFKAVDVIARLGDMLPTKSKIEKMKIEYNSRKCAQLMMDMIEGRRSYIYNGDFWGLGLQSLEEFEVNRRGKN